MILNYEEIEVGDIVCAKTESGDIDVKTLGIVAKKLDKSIYDDMRVIKVDFLYPKKVTSFFPGIYAPKELIKLNTKQLYHIMKCDSLFRVYANQKVKR
jgi:hypothetical protein